MTFTAARRVLVGTGGVAVATAITLLLLAVLSFVLIRTIEASYRDAAVVRSAIFPFVFVAVVLVTGTMVSTVIVSCVNVGFREAHWRSRIAAITVAYVSLVLTFTGVYFVLSCGSDASDATGKYYYYRSFSQDLAADPHLEIAGLKDDRALNGMPDRLWSSVDWPYDVARYDSQAAGRRAYTTSTLVMHASQPFGDVVRFVPSAVGPVLLDCFHFSVDTIATVGYGDIVPGNALTRALSDIEVCCGLALLVFALGMAFASRPSSG